MRISNSILLQATVPWTFALALRKSQLVLEKMHLYKLFSSSHRNSFRSLPQDLLFKLCLERTFPLECLPSGWKLFAWMVWPAPGKALYSGCSSLPLLGSRYNLICLSHCFMRTFKPFPHGGSCGSCELLRKAVGSCVAFLDVSLLNSLARLFLRLEHEEMLCLS